jgi:hypothetical protein
MEMSAPACSASMNALVPDLAIVPRLLIMSALVMPMPVSSIVSVLLALSAEIMILSSGSAASLDASVSDS